MQGISERSHSELLQTGNNAADGNFRLARMVKIEKRKDCNGFYLLGIFALLLNFSCLIEIEPYSLI